MGSKAKAGGAGDAMGKKINALLSQYMAVVPQSNIELKITKPHKSLTFLWFYNNC